MKTKGSKSNRGAKLTMFCWRQLSRLLSLCSFSGELPCEPTVRKRLRRERDLGIRRRFHPAKFVVNAYKGRQIPGFRVGLDRPRLCRAGHFCAMLKMCLLSLRVKRLGPRMLIHRIIKRVPGVNDWIDM